MKILTLCFWTIFVLMAFVSCEQKPLKGPSKIIKMDSIISQLLDSFPNVENNELVKSEANKALKILAKSITDPSYFYDYEMKVYDVAKNKNGSGYIIHYYTEHEYSSPHLANYDLICLTDDETVAKNINSQQKYTVKYCKKITPLDDTMVRIIKSGSNIGHYSPEPVFDFYMKTTATLGAYLCVM